MLAEIIAVMLYCVIKKKNLNKIEIIWKKKNSH